MSIKLTNKSVYDLGKKELKNRTELKLDSGLKVQASGQPTNSQSFIVGHCLLTSLIVCCALDWMQFQ